MASTPSCSTCATSTATRSPCAPRCPRATSSTAPAALALYAVVVLSCYVVIGSSAAKEDAKANFANLQLPYAAPVIDNKSTAYSRDLALFLKEKGAKMYGAFWCSHCIEQKAPFGARAQIPYVECFPHGWERGTPVATACDAEIIHQIVDEAYVIYLKYKHFNTVKKCMIF